ncbi:MAG: hydroxymethylglutaryl-CoA synthase [Candidatus Micrarchaeaceae archaeon]
MAGIIGYGAYIPIYRIKVEDIAGEWHESAEHIKKSLGIQEKSVPAKDEDAVTIAVEAARRAVFHAGIDAKNIGAIYVGSESHPYAVKPTSTIVAQAINANVKLTAADLEFACKAGTAGMQMSMAMVDSSMVKYAMAIGSDTSQGMPGDALEYTASAGGAAFIIGKENSIADIIATSSFTTDTPDFWRRDGMMYPSHGGRFTGEEAYFKHIINATNMVLEKTGYKPSDFAYAVFHQPNGKFPQAVASRLGFTSEQITPGLLTPLIGNTYSGSTLLGLSAVLDIARPGDKILITSFGSGAGSDSFVIEVKDEIESKRERAIKVRESIANKLYINYGIYLKNKNIIKMK